MENDTTRQLIRRGLLNQGHRELEPRHFHKV